MCDTIYHNKYEVSERESVSGISGCRFIKYIQATEWNGNTLRKWHKVKDNWRNEVDEENDNDDNEANEKKRARTLNIVMDIAFRSATLHYQIDCH